MPSLYFLNIIDKTYTIRQLTFKLWKKIRYKKVLLDLLIKITSNVQKKRTQKDKSKANPQRIKQNHKKNFISKNSPAKTVQIKNKKNKKTMKIKRNSQKR